MLPKVMIIYELLSTCTLDEVAALLRSTRYTKVRKYLVGSISQKIVTQSNQEVFSNAPRFTGSFYQDLKGRRFPAVTLTQQAVLLRTDVDDGIYVDILPKLVATLCRNLGCQIQNLTLSNTQLTCRQEIKLDTWPDPYTFDINVLASCRVAFIPVETLLVNL